MTNIKVFDGDKAYKQYTDADFFLLEDVLGVGVDVPIRVKPVLTAARPMIVDMATIPIYDGIVGAGLEDPVDPGVPDTLWRDIDLAYFEADLFGFEAKLGRQHLRMGLPVDIDAVTELIGIGVIEDLIGMVVGHADAVVLSYRTPPIMGLISPRVGAFGLKLDDADPGVCRIRSDHYLKGKDFGLELHVDGVLDLLGVELPGDFELPPGLTVTVAGASRVRRQDFDLHDDVQSEILRLPIAAYVRQSGKIGLWETDVDPVTGETQPWKSYADGPRHWVRSKDVGGHAWVGIVPIVIPGERMPFFAAIHKYRSGDDPATPNIDEAFDPLPHDMLFMPLDPGALLGGGSPIALPEGLDIGTNMRYQLYVAGFMPGDGLIVGGLYAELDRLRLCPERETELVDMGVTPSRDRDFLQMGGLFSVFTWRDISFTLAGIGIRPEDAAFDAIEGMIREDIHIGGVPGEGLWDPNNTAPDAPPPPHPLFRSREWIKALIGMITLSPTEHTSLIIGGAIIDPADHLINMLDYVVYYDARGAILGAIGDEIMTIIPGIADLSIDVTMDPLEQFAVPFMDDPAMAFFMQLAVHF